MFDWYHTTTKFNKLARFLENKKTHRWMQLKPTYTIMCASEKHGDIEKTHFNFPFKF